MQRLVFFLAAFSVACGGGSSSTTPTTPSPAAVSFATLQSAHFTFRYSPLDASSIAQTAAALEAEFNRITDELAVTQMPAVIVTLYPSSNALRQAVTPIVGSIPSFATGLVTGVDAIHLVSPSLASTWTYNQGLVNLIHEFAHCVSLRLNPAIANNPRWLWESVALFEAGQYVDPRTLPSFRSGPLPTLIQLNTIENTTIYDVGATMSLFIVETRGRDTWRALIRANGDLTRVLGVSEADFLAEWGRFVRARFGLE